MKVKFNFKLKIRLQLHAFSLNKFVWTPLTGIIDTKKSFKPFTSLNENLYNKSFKHNMLAQVKGICPSIQKWVDCTFPPWL